MKKFLGLLSTISITAISSTSVISCNHTTDINEYITTTDLGTFYYPKGIKKENLLTSEYELWNKIRELNPILIERDFLSLQNINITNITPSTAHVEGAGFRHYATFIGELTLNFRNEEKETMDINQIIPIANHGRDENGYLSSIYPSMYVEKPDNKSKIDYQTYAIKYIDKLYPKIKDIYNLKDITPMDVEKIINVVEFPLPSNDQLFTEEYIWECIAKYNKTDLLTKEDITISNISNLLDPNVKHVEILGIGPKFDGKISLNFNDKIKPEDLKEKVISNNYEIDDYWEYQEREERYFKISKKPESNVQINGEIIIKVHITFHEKDNYGHGVL